MAGSAQLLVLISCSIVCGAEEFTSQYRSSGGTAHAENILSRQQLHLIQNNVDPALREVKNVSIPVQGHGATAFEQMADDEMRLDQTRAYEHSAHYAPHPSYHQPYPPYPPYPPALPQSYPAWASSHHEPGLPGAQYGGSLYHPASKLSLFSPPSATVGIGKPIDSKAGGKPGGLGGLMSLLGGAAPAGLQLDGVKELFINGFLRPLLVAKGNIKSLISKLIVPVLVLVLINLEILVVVWWLWEECPKGVPPPPPPLAPPPPPPSTPYYPSYPKAAFNYY